MFDAIHVDNPRVIVNPVEHTVISNAQTVPLIACELEAAMQPRILR